MHEDNYEASGKMKGEGGGWWGGVRFERLQWLDHGLICVFQESLEVCGNQWLDSGCILMLKPIRFGGPVPKTLHSQMQGAQVRSLVKELDPTCQN